MTADPRATVAATCACGFVFRYDPAFYAARGLQPPRRCRKCRGARGSTPAPRERGTVVTVFQRGFAFIESDAGGHVFVHRCACGAGVWPLAVADRVEFERVDVRDSLGKNPEGQAVVKVALGAPEDATP